MKTKKAICGRCEKRRKIVGYAEYKADIYFLCEQCANKTSLELGKK